MRRSALTTDRQETKDYHKLEKSTSKLRYRPAVYAQLPAHAMRFAVMDCAAAPKPRGVCQTQSLEDLKLLLKLLNDQQQVHSLLKRETRPLPDQTDPERDIVW